MTGYPHQTWRRDQSCPNCGSYGARLSNHAGDKRNRYRCTSETCTVAEYYVYEPETA